MPRSVDMLIEDGLNNPEYGYDAARKFWKPVNLLTFLIAVVVLGVLFMRYRAGASLLELALLFILFICIALLNTKQMLKPIGKYKVNMRVK